MIHTARIRPSPTAWKRSTALRPGARAIVGAAQNRRTRSQVSSPKPMCAARVLARPPTSRPPMALGCPVREKGPIPGWPIRPVARWQLTIAFTLSVPLEDWLIPWEKRVTTRSVVANQW